LRLARGAVASAVAVIRAFAIASVTAFSSTSAGGEVGVPAAPFGLTLMPVAPFAAAAFIAGASCFRSTRSTIIAALIVKLVICCGSGCARAWPLPPGPRRRGWPNCTGAPASGSKTAVWS